VFLQCLKRQLLQAIRVALAGSGELDHLLRNQVCNRVFSISQAKQPEHVLKDGANRGSQVRLQTFPFEKAVNWHDKPPSFPGQGILLQLIYLETFREPVPASWAATVVPAAHLD
jgi:hypothetical protein